MTLLAGIVTEDSVLFGADGGAVSVRVPGDDPRDDAVPTFPVVKAFSTGDPGLMWGFVGTGGIGLRFRDWIIERTFGSWPDCLDQSADAFSGIVQRYRANIASSGTPDPSRDAAIAATRVMIAGYVAGEPRVLQLLANGESEPWSNPGQPLFLGLFDRSARLAWEVALAMHSQEMTAQYLGRFLRAFVQHAAVLDEPIAVWELHPGEGHPALSAD